MQSVFIRLLSMSLASCAVIAAVLLARLILKRAPKKWSYLLWLVVAFRLCCPISIHSPVSVFSLLPKQIEPAAPATAQYDAAASEAPQSAASVIIPAEQTQESMPSVPASQEQISEQASPAQSAKPKRAVDPYAVAAYIWCAGMGAMLLYGVISLVRLRLALTGAVRVEEGVYESDAVSSPFVLGFFKPVLYIPCGVQGAVLRHVIAHERYHIARGDHLIKAFAFALLAVHWFNPLCWLAFGLMSRDMELSCDEKVLGFFGSDRREYSSALLSFAAGARFPVPSPVAFGENAVRSRIINAMNWKKPKKIVSVISALLCLIVLTACATDPMTPAKTPEPEATAAPRTVSAPYRDGDTVFIPAAFPGDAIPEGVEAAGYTNENGVKGPESFAVLDDGSVLLLDTVNRRIIEYGKDGVTAHALTGCAEPVMFIHCGDSSGAGIIAEANGQTICWNITYSVGGDGSIWYASMQGEGYFVLDAATDRLFSFSNEFEVCIAYPLPKGVKAADVRSIYYDGQGLHLITRDLESSVLVPGDFPSSPTLCWRNDPHFYYTRYEDASVFIIYGKTYNVPAAEDAELRIIGFGGDDSLYVTAYDAASGLVLYRIAADGEVLLCRPVSGGLFLPSSGVFLSDGSLYSMLCTEDGVTIRPIPDAE